MRIGGEVWADTLVALSFGAACFCAGVSWAAYRAVGWVDRMRRWAYSEPVEGVQLLGGPACGGCSPGPDHGGRS